MTTRREAIAAFAGGAVQAAAPRKPNLIVLFADDLGYGDVGCFGGTAAPTPHIDALARGGVRFTDGYVTCAVCSPSRVGLLTGQYQHRHGHEFNSGPLEREGQVGFGVPPSAKLLPRHLKPAGYVSGVFGKWHLGARPGFHPLERGFDEFYGFLTGANDFVTKRTPGASAVGTFDFQSNIVEERKQPIYRGREPVREDRYLTEALAEEASGFIDRHRDRPFFLYLPFNAVHTPLHATARYLDRVAGIADPRKRHHAAMTAALDDAIGAVVKKVREHNLERDTLIFFLSDNGSPIMTGAGSNAPLNGEKVTYYEGGIRVPYIAYWKGRLADGKTYRQPVSSMDISATILAAAGIKPDRTLDGADLLPYLGGRAGAPHPALFWRGGKARAVRKGNWKLLEFGEDFTRLYDLGADVGEKDGLEAKRPEVVRELREAWGSWSAQMKPPAWPPRYREIAVNGVKLNWEL